MFNKGRSADRLKTTQKRIFNGTDSHIFKGGKFAIHKKDDRTCSREGIYVTETLYKSGQKLRQIG